MLVRILEFHLNTFLHTNRKLLQPVLSKISYFKKFFHFLQISIFFPKFYDHMDSRVLATFGSIPHTFKQNTFLWLLKKLAYTHCFSLLACHFSFAHFSHAFVPTPPPCTTETTSAKVTRDSILPNPMSSSYYYYYYYSLDHFSLNPSFFLASGTPCFSGLVSTLLATTF